MHRQKLSRSGANTSRNSLLMKQQADQQHRRVQGIHPGMCGADRNSTPAISRHQMMQMCPEFDGGQQSQQRRRNSQPTQSVRNSPGGSQRQLLHKQPPLLQHHSSLTRNSLETGRNLYAPPSAGQVNQRVTEWLRTAGSLPEEEDQDGELGPADVKMTREVCGQFEFCTAILSLSFIF